MDLKIGDLVKSIDTSGKIIDSEIVSILHKNEFERSNKSRFREILLK